ncbi:putative formin binding protein [Aspergillus undulatus]|uniref:putative formin binding protein n=1 Tax=Aspergillus undulatus TaxID=1810928 RepID=UPI003CCD35D8
MAEYWKSAVSATNLRSSLSSDQLRSTSLTHLTPQPKFWCKQCKIYIRDTAFEKTQHEATAKHQSNLKRFLREIHRDNERSQRDSQRAKDEVERLKSSVTGGGGNTQSQSQSWKKNTPAAAAAPAPMRPASVEERKRQMAQLAEMGVAIPEAYRGDMALAGDWETVSETVVRPEGEEGEEKQGTLGVRKRKAGADIDEEEEEAKKEAERFVSQGWGSRTRRYPGAKDEPDEDLDALLASTKEVKKKDSGTAEGKDTTDGKEDKTEEVKEEGPGIEAPAQEEEPSGVVFKKRKPKAMRK